MRNDNEHTHALKEVIGKAVSILLICSEEPHKENIMTMLQIMGIQSVEEHVKELYIQAQNFMAIR